jgi:type I restriction enzyme S subunit
MLQNLSGGSTFRELSKDGLERFALPFFPFEEQRAIVGVLGVVDSAIESVDRVIAKTERLKKGLTQTLLTRGIGHKEYKDTSIGKTPKTWQTVRLEDVSDDFVGGGTPSTSNPEYWNGDIAWMTSAHINGRLITTGQKYITKKGLENSATNLVPQNNLLVATRVGIGKAAINKLDIAISQDLTGVIINKSKAMPEFLYWFLINSGSRLKSLAQGSTIKGILREELGRLYIPLPSLAEQKKIDEILSTVDKKLGLEKNEKASLERVKRGLVGLLLTGKVRIRVD